MAVWKQRRTSVRLLAVVIGCLAAVGLLRHFTDVQTAAILANDSLAVTKRYSAGWTVTKDEIATLEIRHMRTKDELVLVTKTGAIRVISVEGQDRRTETAQQIAGYFGMRQSSDGRWVMP
jgi:hypothetical protein